MDTKIFIPKLVKVGYNKRPDTYSGKLGYIIYFLDSKISEEYRTEERFGGISDMLKNI